MEIISTPLFFRSLENLYSFDSWEKNEGMPYFEPFLYKFGEMYSADSPFWPFIACFESKDGTEHFYPTTKYR